MAGQASPGKKIIDIARPGASTPSTTAKPVLVSNRPLMQDPMMVDTTTSQPDTAPPLPAPSTKHLKIQPLSRPAAPDVKDGSDDPVSAANVTELPVLGEGVDTSTDAVPEPAHLADESAAAPEDNRATSETKPPTQAPTNGSSQGTPVDEAVLDETAAAEQEKALQKLIEAKTYFLPIETTERRRSRRTVLIGSLVSILLVAAWLDIALDAGLVHIAGLKALTHFFSS